MKVLILGAGKGGTALLELLSHCSGVEVVGVADVNPDAPGLRLARRLHVHTASNAAELVSSTSSDLVVDVTGDPRLAPALQPVVPTGTEWLGGAAARLVWLLVQQEHDLRAQLVRADKLSTIGTFAAQIAHDLRNPLYSIREFARFIDEESDLEQIKEYAHEIQKADRYLTSMVEGLTGYTQSPTDSAVPVNLAQVVDQALMLSRYATSTLDVEVIRHYADVPRLAADSSELLQIFVNLITNALQAMNGPGRLTLGVEAADNAVVVTIQDTGPGIAPEHRPKIFQPFFTTKDRNMGTGLGLSIVQTLVKKYGGDIDVDSEMGKGTLFRIRFPVDNR